MVKIMLQIAITLFLDNADVEFEVGVGQSMLAFKTNAETTENFHINVGFVAKLNR